MGLEESLVEAHKRMETRQYFEGKITLWNGENYELQLCRNKRGMSMYFLFAGRVLSQEKEDGDLTQSPLPPSLSQRPRSSPSEKARFHYRSTHLSAMSVGKEMSLRDPHYRPAPAGGAAACKNPFLTLPQLREGRKIIGGSSRDLFSSCFELPSPARVATPTGSTILFGGASDQERPKALLAAVASSMADCRGETKEEEDPSLQVKEWGKRSTRSLPSTPTGGSRRSSLDGSSTPLASMSEAASALSSSPTVAGSKASSNGHRALCSSASTSRFEDHLFQGRVQLLKRLYSGGTWTTQDDSVLLDMSRQQHHQQSYPLLRRRGSCESGFYSVGTDDLFANDSGGLSSGRSLGSSLLTVSDLEEDLWAASAFLSGKQQQQGRTSSIFTDDSQDDLDSADEHRPRWALVEHGYEKDIRDIVDYFEATCRMEEASYPLQRHHRHHHQVPKEASSGRYRALWLQRRQEQQQKVSLQLPRSPKIESLIKRVVEKESRERLASRYSGTPVSTRAPHGALGGPPSSRLQVCDGIVSSKLPLFDQTKQRCPVQRGSGYDQQGLVKSRMAMFDGRQQQAAAAASAMTMSTKKMAERRLARILKHQQQQPLLPKEPVETGAGALGSAKESDRAKNNSP